MVTVTEFLACGVFVVKESKMFEPYKIHVEQTEIQGVYKLTKEIGEPPFNFVYFKQKDFTHPKRPKTETVLIITAWNISVNEIEFINEATYDLKILTKE